MARNIYSSKVIVYKYNNGVVNQEKQVVLCMYQGMHVINVWVWGTTE